MATTTISSLPVEVWGRICSFLPSKDLRAVRQICQNAEAEGRRVIFHTVILSTKSWRLERFCKIAKDWRTAKHVKTIIIDLRSLWQPGPHSRDEIDGLVSSGLKRHRNEWIDCKHPALHEAIGNLTEVDNIIMSTKHTHYHCPGHSPPSPRRLRGVFAQTLALISKLKQPLRKLQFATNSSPQLTLDILNAAAELKSMSSLFPSLTRAQDLAALEMPMEYSLLHTLSNVQDLDLHLFDGFLKEGHALSVHAFSQVLSSMASNLRRLRVVVSTPYEWGGYMVRVTCLSHTHGGLQDDMLAVRWSSILGEIPFPKITHVHVQNVLWEPRCVGQFLRKHIGTLKHVQISTWSCDVTVLSPSELRCLRQVAGSAISVLTYEQASSEGQQLCVLNQPIGETRHCYYCIKAEKLAALLLDHNVVVNALVLAICQQVDVRMCDDKSYVRGGLHIAAEHIKLKDRQYPAYAEAMNDLPASELAQRGETKRQLLVQYQALLIGGDWIPPHSDGFFLVDLRQSASRLYAIHIDDKPNLFRYSTNGFERAGFVQKDNAMTPEYREDWIPAWLRDNITDILNAQFPVPAWAHPVASIADAKDAPHDPFEGMSSATYSNMVEGASNDAPSPWHMPYDMTTSTDIKQQGRRARDTIRRALRERAWAMQAASTESSGGHDDVLSAMENMDQLQIDT